MRGRGKITTHSPCRLDRAVNGHRDMDKMRRTMLGMARSMAQDATEEDVSDMVSRAQANGYTEVDSAYIRRLLAKYR